MLALSLVVAAVTAAPLAQANGSYSHIHISQLAYEALPDGPVRMLLADPDVMLACERGSMFPDSGYAADDEYGEFAHWEPFHEAFIQHLRLKHGGQFDSPEAQREIAFLLGVMSHGMADQIYDTTLLARGFEVDGPEPDGVSVDQYADYFIIVDEQVVLSTSAGGPYEDLTTVLSEEMGRDDLASATLKEGMDLMELSIGAQLFLGEVLYLKAWQTFPWLGTHIYNDAAVGSLPDLGQTIARYWLSVWDRLHGADDPDERMILRTIPADGAQNFPIDTSVSAVYSRIGIVFGYGVKASETFPRITLRAPGGSAVPVDNGSPYGGEDRSFLYFSPQQPLAYDTTYTVEVAAGVAALGGQITTQPYTFSFRTRCSDDKLSDCPPLDPPLETGEIPTSLPDHDTEPQPEPAVAAEESGCAVASGRTGSAWVLGSLWSLALILLRGRRSHRPGA